jgi:hypothetical protein
MATPRIERRSNETRKPINIPAIVRRILDKEPEKIFTRSEKLVSLE